MNENINISVSANDEPTQQLGESIAQLEKRIKQLRMEFKATATGTQDWDIAQQELNRSLQKKDILMKDVGGDVSKARQAYFDYGLVTRTVAVDELGLTDKIKSARKERRLYMFAVREAMTAVTSLTGEEKGLSKAMTSGAGSVFGMKFALDAMGAGIYALPIALLIGAFVVIKDLFLQNKQQAKELNGELQRQYDLNVKLGIITPQQQSLDRLKKYNEEKRKQSEIEEKIAAAERLRSSYLIMKPSTPEEQEGVSNAVVGLTSDLKDLNNELVKQTNNTKEADLALDEQNKSIKANNAELEKAYKAVKDSNYQKQAQLGDISLLKQKAQLEKDIAGVKKEISGYLLTSTGEKTQAQLDAEGRLLDKRLALKGVNEEIDKQQEDADKKAEKALDDQVKLVKEKADLKKMSYPAAIQELKLLEQQTDSEQKRLEIEKDIADLQKKELERQAKSGTFKERTRANLKEYQKEADSTTLAVNGITDAVQGFEGGFSNAVSGVLQGTQNIGQGMSAMGSVVKRVLSEIIARMLVIKALSFILGLFTGGASSAAETGTVSGMASGGFIPSGSDWEGVVGENGTEGMKVSRRGVQIISNKQFNEMNGGEFHSRSSGSDGSLLDEMRMVNRNFSRLQNASNTGVYLMSAEGQKQLRGRVSKK